MSRPMWSQSTDSQVVKTEQKTILTSHPDFTIIDP